MSMTLRLLTMALVHLIAVVYGWHFLIETLGQTARYLPAGWWASLLALVMLGMGLMIPAGALLVSLLLGALLLRLAPAAAGQPVVNTGIAVLFFALAYAAGGLLMWQLAPPTPHAHSSYGLAFQLLSVSMVVCLGLLCGLATSWWLRLIQPRLAKH